jgi:hypothetical protein
MWWPPASVNATPVAKAVQEWITAVGDKRGVRWMVTVNATPIGLLSVGPKARYNRLHPWPAAGVLLHSHILSAGGQFLLQLNHAM